MYYLSKYYGFSLLAFKLYRPNLITNDGYIKHYQNVHRDFKITFLKIAIKLGSSTTPKKKLHLVIRKTTLKAKQNLPLLFKKIHSKEILSNY